MLTDNSSPAYKSTLDASLDLFSAAANADGDGTLIPLSPSFQSYFQIVCN